MQHAFVARIISGTSRLGSAARRSATPQCLQLSTDWILHRSRRRSRTEEEEEEGGKGGGGGVCLCKPACCFLIPFSHLAGKSFRKLERLYSLRYLSSTQAEVSVPSHCPLGS